MMNIPFPGLLVEETRKALTDDEERELTARESFRWG